MINLLSIGLIAVIVVLLLLLWSAKTRVKNCQEDNVKMVMLLADKTKNEGRLKILIKRMLNDINTKSFYARSDVFYFKVLDAKLKEINVEAIRFKKKDGKILTYINGAMIPTDDLIYIKNPLINGNHESKYKFITNKFKDVKENNQSIADLLNQIK